MTLEKFGSLENPFIKKLDDFFELQLLKKGDRVIIYYNEGENEGPIRDSNIKPDLVYGNFKDFYLKYPGYGYITLTNSMELYTKFKELNNSTLQLLESIRKSKALYEEKEHDINGFYKSPNAFGIYLIRNGVDDFE
jgi:hypothetical protein